MKCLSDAFSDLDPLGTGRIRPYVDKKFFFHELKNPPKKVLNDLTISTVTTTLTTISIASITTLTCTTNTGATATITSIPPASMEMATILDVSSKKNSTVVSAPTTFNANNLLTTLLPGNDYHIITLLLLLKKDPSILKVYIEYNHMIM